MEKSKTLFTEEEIKKSSYKLFSFPYTFFGVLFFGFLYLAVGFSLLSSIYLLAISGLTGIAWIGILIFKFWIISWAGFCIFILIKAFYELFHLTKLKRFERREQFKKELIKEIENGRRNKARQPRKKSN